MTNIESLTSILKILLQAPKSALRIFRYFYLCLKAREKGKMKFIFVGVKHIATQCSCSIRTVQYMLRRYESLIFCMQRERCTSLYDLNIDLVKALDFLDQQKTDLLGEDMQKSRVDKFIKKTLRSLTRSDQKLHHPPSKTAPYSLSSSSNNLRREDGATSPPLFNSKIQEIHHKVLSNYPSHIVDAYLSGVGKIMMNTLDGLVVIDYSKIDNPEAYCKASAKKNMMNALRCDYRAREESKIYAKRA